MVVKQREPSTKKAYESIAYEINLPTNVAFLVIFNHLLVLFFPIILQWQIYIHHEYVAQQVTYPFMLHVATSILMAANAFEIAQNTYDRWYYTGKYDAFCNILFYTLINASMAAIVAACQGLLHPIALVVAYGSTILLPIFYLINWLIWPFLVLTTGVAAYGMFLAFGDPSIFLVLVLYIGSAIYLYKLIFATHNQYIHGFIVILQGLGFLLFPWVISNGFHNTQKSWAFVGIVSLILILLMAILYRPLSKLPPTPKVQP